MGFGVEALRCAAYLAAGRTPSPHLCGRRQSRASPARLVWSWGWAEGLGRGGRLGLGLGFGFGAAGARPWRSRRPALSRPAASRPAP